MKKYLALLISIGSLAATLAPVVAAAGPENTTAQTTTPTARAVPSEAIACLPTAQVVRTELLGSSIYQGKTYYLISAYNPGGFPSDVVIATQKDKCERLYYNPSGENAPFPNSVPESVGQELNSQRPK